MSTLTLHFRKAKETKGTWKFDELLPTDGSRPAVGSIYVTKPMLLVLDNPDLLVVTLAKDIN